MEEVKISTSRRGFLGRALAAPWVIRSGVLMPIWPLVAAPLIAGGEVLEKGVWYWVTYTNGLTYETNPMVIALGRSRGRSDEGQG